MVASAPEDEGGKLICSQCKSLIIRVSIDVWFYEIAVGRLGRRTAGAAGAGRGRAGAGAAAGHFEDWFVVWLGFGD